MINKDFLVSASEALFDSALGKKIEISIRETIDKNSMNEHLKKGVLLGLSGGADSILLLIFLRKLAKEMDFNLSAVHINHMIRGEDANFDEKFSSDFASALGIDFQSVSVDVPALAKAEKRGIEEMARNVRYREFQKIIERSDKLKTIVTAHNSTDNLETFVFNLMRGSGLNGLSGICALRDNIVRPLINVSKEDIVKLLTDAKIPFVTDKTNFSTDYTRNYIRHEILPKLKHLASSPEQMASKAMSNLRSDCEYIDKEAEKFFFENLKNNKIETDKLRNLHPALIQRVIKKMAKSATVAAPEKVHIEKIIELLHSKRGFEYDIPGAVTFFDKNNFAYVAKREISNARFDVEIPIKDGFNEVEELGIGIAVTDSKNEDFSSNVYKFSIQANISSAIIFGRLRVRTRRDGDSYFYGSMTRRLKKLFNDRKMSEEERNTTPVIVDDKGIVWVAGFGVRDDSPKEKKQKWITIYKK